MSSHLFLFALHPFPTILTSFFRQIMVYLRILITIRSVNPSPFHISTRHLLWQKMFCFSFEREHVLFQSFRFMSIRIVHAWVTSAVGQLPVCQINSGACFVATPFLKQLRFLGCLSTGFASLSFALFPASQRLPLSHNLHSSIFILLPPSFFLSHFSCFPARFRLSLHCRIFACPLLFYLH